MIQEHEKELFKNPQKCAYCDTPLSLRTGVDMFAVVQMHFSAYAIDANTGIPASIQTMDRGLDVHMCPTCFDAFSNHMKEFTNQYSKTYNAGQPFVVETLEASQIPQPMVAKPYKAVEGSVRNSTGRIVPPKTSADAIIEGA